jgi:hypothetical protein
VGSNPPGFHTAFHDRDLPDGLFRRRSARRIRLTIRPQRKLFSGSFLNRFKLVRLASPPRPRKHLPFFRKK